MRYKAIKELRKNLKWRGVITYLRWPDPYYAPGQPVWKVLIHEPEKVYQAACALTDGAFI